MSLQFKQLELPTICRCPLFRFTLCCTMLRILSVPTTVSQQNLPTVNRAARREQVQTTARVMDKGSVTSTDCHWDRWPDNIVSFAGCFLGLNRNYKIHSYWIYCAMCDVYLLGARNAFPTKPLCPKTALSKCKWAPFSPQRNERQEQACTCPKANFVAATTANVLIESTNFIKFCVPVACIGYTPLFI